MATYCACCFLGPQTWQWLLVVGISSLLAMEASEILSHDAIYIYISEILSHDTYIHFISMLLGRFGSEASSFSR